MLQFGGKVTRRWNSSWKTCVHNKNYKIYNKIYIYPIGYRLLYLLIISLSAYFYMWYTGQCYRLYNVKQFFKDVFLFSKIK